MKGCSQEDSTSNEFLDLDYVLFDDFILRIEYVLNINEMHVFLC